MTYSHSSTKEAKSTKKYLLLGKKAKPSLRHVRLTEGKRKKNRSRMGVGCK